jgi:uncharacterized membrane protein
MKPVYSPLAILSYGASQTLMLENIYHLSGRTSAAVIVLLLGVDLEFHSVPLSHVNLKSDFALVQTVVGVP